MKFFPLYIFLELKCDSHTCSGTKQLRSSADTQVCGNSGCDDNTCCVDPDNTTTIPACIDGGQTEQQQNCQCGSVECDISTNKFCYTAYGASEDACHSTALRNPHTIFSSRNFLVIIRENYYVAKAFLKFFISVYIYVEFPILIIY
jgi:hypothetical protein